MAPLWAYLIFTAFAVQLVAAAPKAIKRPRVTVLARDEVAEYAPYTHYAGAAYCEPNVLKSWTCGSHCTADAGLKVVDAGGDGGEIQHWYVGYDPQLQSVIVGYQGTDKHKIDSILTDLLFFKNNLDPKLFPKVSKAVEVHGGFADAHARSAAKVLAAVKKAMQTFKTTKVSITGHSLGGALAVIATLHLALNLPKGTQFRTVTFGAPRVGNKEFAKLVDSVSEMNRIVNKHDPVPIIPGLLLGFQHTEGEIHITNDGRWVNCPMTEDDNPDCTRKYTSNIAHGKVSDHNGPYGGIKVTCSGK